MKNSSNFPMLFAGSISVASLAVVGCVSYSVVPAPGKTPTPKAMDSCSFEVAAREPAGEFDEIGTVTVTSATSSPEKFQSAIKEDVCRLGGDAVVTQVNGLGQIIRGVVLRRK